MDADDFRDYMLSCFLLRYLSDNYETAAERKLVEVNASVMAGGGLAKGGGGVGGLQSGKGEAPFSDEVAPTRPD